MISRRVRLIGLLGLFLVSQAGTTVVAHAQRARACGYNQWTDTWYTNEHNPSNNNQVDQVSNNTTYYYTSGCGSASKSFYGYAISQAFSQSAQWASLRFLIANIVVGPGSLDQAPYTGAVCNSLPTAASFYEHTTNPGSYTVYQITAWGDVGAVNCAQFDNPTYTYTHQPS